MCGGLYFAKDLGVVALQTHGTGMMSNGLSNGIAGRGEIEQQPGFEAVFGKVDTDATGLWFEAGALLAPAPKSPSPLCGEIQALAVYSNDLLAEERVKMAKKKRILEEQCLVEDGVWMCEVCTYSNDPKKVAPAVREFCAGCHRFFLPHNTLPVASQRLMMHAADGGEETLDCQKRTGRPWALCQAPFLPGPFDAVAI